jgi:hypothetical protein
MTFRVFDAGAATSSTAIDTDIKLSRVGRIVAAHPIPRELCDGQAQWF